jgi:hypothetical protein
MQNHYILIDFENVQVKSLALLQGAQFHVRVFLGPKNTRLPTDLVLAMKSLGDRADYILLDSGGQNALDFHITYYLGRLAANDTAGCFYIISKDTGFDSLIEHMNKSGVMCSRAASIESLPCVDNPAVPADNVVAAKVAPKAKPVTKKKAAELVELVLANLAKRKAALPRTEKTLRSTIKMLCGAQYSDKEIDAVFNRLVKEGHVVVDGERFSYRLLDESRPV